MDRNGYITEETFNNLPINAQEYITDLEKKLEKLGKLPLKLYRLKEYVQHKPDCDLNRKFTVEQIETMGVLEIVIHCTCGLSKLETQPHKLKEDVAPEVLKILEDLYPKIEHDDGIEESLKWKIERLILIKKLN